MRLLILGALGCLALCSCAAGSAVSCASAWSSYSQEAESLTAEGERELVQRLDERYGR